MIVDAIKKNVPDLPSWSILVLAAIVGQALVWLALLYSGSDLTVQTMAGAILAGLGATGAAVASTELHAAARPSDDAPEYPAGV